MNFDPVRMFRLASAFDRARRAAILDRALPNDTAIALDWEIAAPFIALEAFSSELYLKCLITIDGGHRGGHDLGDLIAALTDASKRRVLREYRLLAAQQIRAGQPGIQANLAKLLKYYAKAFPEFRYIYEQNVFDPSAMGCLSVLRHAVRQVILERRPDLFAVDQLQ